MKKIVTSLILAVLAAMCSVVFVGCDKMDDVTGDTFVTEAEWDEAFLNARVEMNYTCETIVSYGNDAINAKIFMNENGMRRVFEDSNSVEEYFEIKANDGHCYFFNKNGEQLGEQKAVGGFWSNAIGGSSSDPLYGMFGALVNYSDLKYIEEEKVFKCEKVETNYEDSKYVISNAVVEFNEKQLTRLEYVIEEIPKIYIGKANIKIYDFRKTKIELPDNVEVVPCNKADKNLVKAWLKTIPAKSFTYEIVNNDGSAEKNLVAGKYEITFTKKVGEVWSEPRYMEWEYRAYNYLYTRMGEEGLREFSGIAEQFHKTEGKEGVYRADCSWYARLGYIEITIKDEKLFKMEWGDNGGVALVYDIDNTVVTRPESPLTEEVWNDAVTKVREERNYTFCSYLPSLGKAEALFTRNNVYVKNNYYGGTYEEYQIDANDKWEYYRLTQNEKGEWRKSEAREYVDKMYEGNYTIDTTFFDYITFGDINSEADSVEKKTYKFGCADTVLSDGEEYKTELRNIYITFEQGNIIEISADYVQAEKSTGGVVVGEVVFYNIGTTEIDLP